uniref:cAMP-dependent protein kinase n=1 Tax=Ganoderma boninense TaxID=34458 RepID=A0A5K1JTK4_9APHY|nr:Vinclozolin resistance protein [Ganoderma boninense]
MLSGQLPFHEPGLSSVDLYAKILQGSSYIAWPVSLDMNAKDLMLKLMERDPSKRLGNLAQGVNDVLAHPWFAEVDWKKLMRREIAAPYLPSIANDGDASAFDRYPEDDAATGYGETTPDPYGHRFPEFEYTSI